MRSGLQRVTIVGLGLIGGSWALALKERGLRVSCVGCDRPEILERARSAGIVQEGSADLATAVDGAGLIILATPVGAILEQLSQLKPHVAPGALITDTGSTKRLICGRAQEIFGKEPLFVGGHPLAGKERSGFRQADARLFEGTRYVLTPLAPQDVNDERVRSFAALVKAVGARPYITDAAAHDRALAFLSHLPQLLSSGLASTVAERVAREPLSLELAASGFRDMTRLAEGPFELWKDICRTNRENIQAALDALIEKLEEIKSRLDDAELEREFRQALKLREELRNSE